MADKKIEIVSNGIQNDLQEENDQSVQKAMVPTSGGTDEVNEMDEMDDESVVQRQNFVTQTRDSGRVQNFNQRSVRNKAK